MPTTNDKKFSFLDTTDIIIIELLNKTMSTMMQATHQHSPPIWKKGPLKSRDSHKTFLWWKTLCSISVGNILLWTWTYANSQEDQLNLYRKYHLILSGIYTFVCAYRSVLPRIDLERYCLFDTQFSSIVLGRSAATIAEISFATQLGLLMHEYAINYQHPVAECFSFFIPPLLTLAQCFCWMGVVTRNHVYHAVEESLWAIAFVGIFWVTAIFAYEGYEEISKFAIVGSIMSAGTLPNGAGCRSRPYPFFYF